MTTTITINTDAGWPVEARFLAPGAPITHSVRVVVPPKTTKHFHVWDGMDLHIHEMRKDEPTE